LNPGNDAFSQDATRAVHYGVGGATLWDVAAGRAIRVVDPRPTQAACFLPGAGAVDFVAAVFGERGTELVAFDASGNRIRALPMPTAGRVTAIAASPKAHVVVVGDDVGDVQALDTATGQWSWTLRAAHPGGVTCLAFAPDGRTILSGGADGVLRLADAAVGRPLRVVARGDSAVRAALFSSDGRRVVATVGDGRTTRSWDLSLAETFRPNANAALTTAGHMERASFAEKLRLVDWYLLAGREEWVKRVLPNSDSMPHELDSATRLAFAHGLWAAGDAAAASRVFADALNLNPASEDQTYLVLCRDAAAAGGEP
jgi:WD40 repeat protein